MSHHPTLHPIASPTYRDFEISRRSFAGSVSYSITQHVTLKSGEYGPRDAVKRVVDAQDGERILVRYPLGGGITEFVARVVTPEPVPPVTFERVS